MTPPPPAAELNVPNLRALWGEGLLLAYLGPDVQRVEEAISLLRRRHRELASQPTTTDEDAREMSDALDLMTYLQTYLTRLSAS